jgi:hypothetical protein
MTPEAKFSDPEVHCLKFGNLSDTSCQVEGPPVNFSPHANTNRSTPTCSRPPRILPGSSSPIHTRAGHLASAAAPHTWPASCTPAPRTPAPSASPYLSPLRPRLPHGRAASARRRVRSKPASVTVLTPALPLLPRPATSPRGSPRRRTSTPCARPRTGDHGPGGTTVPAALCAGHYRRFGGRQCRGFVIFFACACPGNSMEHHLLYP